MLRTNNLCCKDINTYKYGLHKCCSCFTRLSYLNAEQMEKSIKEQFAHDTSREDYVMDCACRLTTPNNELKHHARKAHKKTWMVVGMMCLHRADDNTDTLRGTKFSCQRVVYTSTSSPPKEKGRPNRPGAWIGQRERKTQNGWRKLQRESLNKLLGD